jgi:antitoxin component of RelBE/YafQ-DinJ toxin-antitoxin module
MGISLSTLVSAALSQVARTRKLELVAYTDNGFTTEYEDSVIQASKDEPVFVAKNAADIDTFFESLS